MKLIVGLGNPDAKHQFTRHNMGFLVLDYMLKNQTWNKKFEALYCQQIINNEKIIFIKPQTYMNLSGFAVKEFVNYFKINLNDILIIQDDLDMEIGKIRLKKDSRSGGHNGIQSIIDNLGTKEFLRLKIGIGKDSSMESSNYVLGKFSSEDLELIEEKMPIYAKYIANFINGEYDK